MNLWSIDYFYNVLCRVSATGFIALTYAAGSFSCAKVRWTNIAQVLLSLPEMKFDDSFP